MTRNQIIILNIFLAIPIVPVRVVLFVLYWITKWIHDSVDWAFDNFPALITIPKTQKQIEEEERKACERLIRIQRKFQDDLEQDKNF